VGGGWGWCLAQRDHEAVGHEGRAPPTNPCYKNWIKSIEENQTKGGCKWNRRDWDCVKESPKRERPTPKGAVYTQIAPVGVEMEPNGGWYSPEHLKEKDGGGGTKKTEGKKK